MARGGWWAAAGRADGDFTKLVDEAVAALINDGKLLLSTSHATIMASGGWWAAAGRADGNFKQLVAEALAAFTIVKITNQASHQSLLKSTALWAAVNRAAGDMTSIMSKAKEALRKVGVVKIDSISSILSCTGFWPSMDRFGGDIDDAVNTVRDLVKSIFVNQDWTVLVPKVMSYTNFWNALSVVVTKDKKIDLFRQLVKSIIDKSAELIIAVTNEMKKPSYEGHRFSRQEIISIFFASSHFWTYQSNFMTKNIDEWVYPWSTLGCAYGSKQHLMAIVSERK